MIKQGVLDVSKVHRLCTAFQCLYYLGTGLTAISRGWQWLLLKVRYDFIRRAAEWCTGRDLSDVPRTGIAQRIESRSSICWKGLSVACVWQSRGGCVSLLGVFAAETGRVEWEQSSQFKSVWKSSVSLPVSAGHRRLSLWIESFCQTFVCKPFLHIYGEENPEKSMTMRLPPNPPHHERCAKNIQFFKNVHKSCKDKRGSETFNKTDTATLSLHWPLNG